MSPGFLGSGDAGGPLGAGGGTSQEGFLLCFGEDTGKVKVTFLLCSFLKFLHLKIVSMPGGHVLGCPESHQRKPDLRPDLRGPWWSLFPPQGRRLEQRPRLKGR